MLLSQLVSMVRKCLALRDISSCKRLDLIQCPEVFERPVNERARFLFAALVRIDEQSARMRLIRCSR